MTMPDITTHILFGREVGAKLSASLQQMIRQHPAAFYFGTQGPDLFFFRKALPHTNPIHRYGSIIHKHRVPQTLAFCQKTMRDPAAPDALKAYLIGFYCHYFLDSTLHPYVYFLTGRICERAPDHPSAVHAKIEAELDSVFCAHFLHIPVSQFPVTRYFRIPEEDKNAISLWYQTLLKEVFRLPAGLKNIRHCFGDFSQLGAAFYAHPYILSGLGAFLSKLYQPAQIIAAHIKSPQVTRDTANLKHRPWHHPDDHKLVSRQSAFDLFDEAERSAVLALKAVFQPEKTLAALPFPVTRNFSGNILDKK